jgi:putative transcriptional regulator
VPRRRARYAHLRYLLLPGHGQKAAPQCRAVTIPSPLVGPPTLPRIVIGSWNEKDEFKSEKIGLAASLHHVDVSINDVTATVNAIETGRYDPSLPLAFKIAALFGQPIEEIFSVEGVQPRPLA